MSNVSISTSNLKIGYDQKVVRRDLSFSLYQGEMVCRGVMAVESIYTNELELAIQLSDRILLLSEKGIALDSSTNNLKIAINKATLALCRNN